MVVPSGPDVSHGLIQHKTPFYQCADFSFGGLRIFVKARYPDRIFDRPEDMEIIQLKLGQGLIQKQLRE